MKMDNEVLSQEMLQYENDLAWVIENYDGLIKEYAEKFIAVLDRKVIEHSSKIEELVKALSSKYQEDLPRILVEFIYKEHPNFVM
jgi:hypothetical protein